MKNITESIVPDSKNNSFLQDSSDIETGDSRKDDIVGTLRIDITDSGVGIAPENQSKVFGQFAQFNRNELQSGGGSGLGLWISRQIVHMHGGKMGFSSKGLGHGCTFFFEMPIYRDEKCNPKVEYKISADEAKSAASFLQEACKYIGEAMVENPCCKAFVGHKSIDHSNNSKEIAKSNSDNAKSASSINAQFHESFVADPNFKLTSNVNVLIVDDSSMNRKIIRRMIDFEKETLPHVTFFEADDGRSALDLMQDNLQKGLHFDFVLMDFVMITMHGPEAASIMRNSLRYSGPIIGVTGNALQQDIDHFIQQGADLILLKPLTREKLIDGLQCTYNAMHK
jgi:CheY-like chemotaxis protein